jgi:hypothetical protein
MPNTQILKDLAQYVTDENEKALLTLMGSYSDEGRVRQSIATHFFAICYLIRLNIKNGFLIVIVQSLLFLKIYHP